MSVIFQGVSMPQVCEDCPAYSEDYLMCRAKEKEFERNSDMFTKRPDWCPAVEVKSGNWISKPGLIPRIIDEEGDD